MFNSSLLFMFILLPANILFCSIIVISTLLTLMANNVIIIWVGLELNLLAIIPLLINSYHINESESAIKYFIIQAIGGILFLLGSLRIPLREWSILYNEKLFRGFTNPIPPTIWEIYISKIPILLFLSGLLIKLGAAPFHFWFPQVISGISWPICILITTWQKIPPLIIISYLSKLGNYIYWIILIGLIGVIVGGIIGINQTQLRPLLAYSSVAHIGWILLAINLATYIILIYLSIYIIISLAIIIVAYINNQSAISIITPIKSFSYLTKLYIIILLFRYGGIPPLQGFLPKLIVSYSIVAHSIYILIVITIIFSLIPLYYYFNLLFNCFIYPQYIPPTNQIRFNLIITSFIFLGTFPLPILVNLWINCALTLLY